MPRRRALVIFCIAAIASVSLFLYNAYFTLHLPFTVSNELNRNVCSNNCASPTLHSSATPTLLPTPSNTPDPSLMLPGYRLVWNDEFNGTQLDPSKWYVVNSLGSKQQQGCCLNYSYSSVITPDQAQVHDGMLTITTERNTGGGPAYKTGAITTETLSDIPTFTFTYGRIDIRARLPRGRGVWPAMWLVTSPATAPASYEIDIMEMLGEDPHTLYQVVHHGQDREYCSDKGPDYSQAFHIFTLDWEPGKLTWAIDGQTLCTATRLVPSQPMYIIINTALSDGNWGEAVSSSTPLPQTFKIDYVRVYKRIS
jgi:beta-glucanase (GH16 family)